MSTQPSASELVLLDTRYQEDEARVHSFQPPSLSNGGMTTHDCRKMLESDVWVLSEELALQQRISRSSAATMQSKLEAMAAERKEKEALLEEREAQLIEVWKPRPLGSPAPNGERR